MSANNRITVVDIQHKTFKRALQGYDRTDVDQFLDELIETLEDEASARAALEAEIADMKERISHFKSMEESLQSTLLLAQRTADEVKAAAHKEADLIRQEARLQGEREIGNIGDRIEETRREHQRLIDAAEKAKSEIRSLLMSHLALIERPSSAPTHLAPPAPVPAASAPYVPAASAPVAPPAPEPPPEKSTHLLVPGIVGDDSLPMPMNGSGGNVRIR
jgi:cell division initiation protein